MPKLFKIAILSILLINLFSLYSYAGAQSQNDSYVGSGAQASIEQFLCSPSKTTDRAKTTNTGYTTTGDINANVAAANNNASGDLYICINRIYRFAIVFAGAFGVFMIVLAGYIYMSADGNEESVSKAKDMLTTTIVSLIILMAGYVLLRALNPDLIQFQKIQPNSVVLNPADKPVISEPDLSGAPPPTTDQTSQPPSTSAQQAAQQILSNQKITLATGHPSGKTDSATARQNVTDTAQGKAVQRSSYTDGGITGPGGTYPLGLNMLNALQKLSQNPYNYSFRVSEIAGGVHSSNKSDPHYTGRAFDVDQINGSAVSSSNKDYKAFMAACTALGANQVLGPGNAGHDTHVHCGWAN